MNYVDPDGRDAYVFDSNGNFVQKIEQKEKHYISVREFDEQGNYIEQRIRFADPKNDSADIDNGRITQLIFVSEEEMRGMLEGQGTFEENMINFVRESVGSGKYDYTNSVLWGYSNGSIPNNTRIGNRIYGNLRTPTAIHSPVSSFLFVPERDGMAHNLINFGNYLWGASGFVVGYNLTILKAGAHFNSIFNFKKNGYDPQLDSKDDQRSISQGYYHAKNNGY